MAECSCQIVRCCLTFAYCIGASGGAGNLASYLAGQRGRNLRFFTEHIHTPGYFGLRSFLKTGNLFGLQYIYGTLTNSTGKDPLDFPTLKNNPSEYEIVVTNALTGKAEYFGKETMAQGRLSTHYGIQRHSCRPYPQIISLIDHRHIAYNQNLQEVFCPGTWGQSLCLCPQPSHSCGNLFYE